MCYCWRSRRCEYILLLKETSAYGLKSKIKKRFSSTLPEECRPCHDCGYSVRTSGLVPKRCETLSGPVARARFRCRHRERTGRETVFPAIFAPRAAKGRVQWPPPWAAFHPRRSEPSPRLTKGPVLPPIGRKRRFSPRPNSHRRGIGHARERFRESFCLGRHEDAVTVLSGRRDVAKVNTVEMRC